MKKWFCSVHAQYTRGRSWKSVDEYIELRVWDGAFPYYVDALPCFCSAFDAVGLTEELFTPFGMSPVMWEMARFAGRHIGIINDVVAVKKEYERGDMNTLVLVLHKAEGMEVWDGIRRGVKLVNDYMASFHSLKDYVEGNEMPEADTHAADLHGMRVVINTLDDWMIGHMNWYYCDHNRRYATGFNRNEKLPGAQQQAAQNQSPSTGATQARRDKSSDSQSAPSRSHQIWGSFPRGNG